MNNKLMIKKKRAEDRLVELGYLEHKTRSGRLQRVKEVCETLSDISKKTGVNVAALTEVCDCMVIDGKYEYHQALNALDSLFEAKN